MILLHGTTYDAFQKIILNGFKDADPVWICSNPNKTYLVAVGDHYQTDEAVRIAYEAGQIAAAKSNTHCEDIVVFIFDFPDDIADKELYNDISCENTEGFYEINNDTLNKLIDAGKISYDTKTIEHAYIPWLRPFYLAYLNRENIELDDKLTSVCEKIRSSGIEMYDEIFDDTTDLNELCETINCRKDECND